MMELHTLIAGEPFTLHADRALWWPRQRSLLVADMHFGKGSVLRRAGMAVPTGQTFTDLARLDALIALYQPAQLIVLGDLVHGSAPGDAAWITQVSQWRRRHADIAMILIAGNHDRHFDTRELGFTVIAESLRIGDIVLRHEPAVIADGYVLAGHVHPGIRLNDGWRRHRLPAFRLGKHCGLLPAFGALTGLFDTPRMPGERLFAVTPAGLIPVAAEP